jgi:polyisoprenyl-phosphate glycosyltransferase
MIHMHKISIVIPVYNSEECIEELVSEIDAALDTYELILVNDCSSDSSWLRIEEAASGNEKITGINLRKNFGQDNALMAGLNHATGDYVVIMDDDLQHSPSDIPVLYEKIREGYDVVYANFAAKKQARWKNFGSWLNGKLAEIVIHKPAWIYLSPFKIIDKQVVDEIVEGVRFFV